MSRNRAAGVAVGRQLDIVQAMLHPGLFAPFGFAGESWGNWRVILKAAFALPMDEAELEVFRTLAGRDPPRRRVKELWIVGGRRGGKDSIAALIIAWMATFFQPRGRLRRGEKALCQLLAVDRDQSGIVLDYVRPFFRDIAPLRDMVVSETPAGLVLANDVEIKIVTNTYRGIRGKTVLCSVFDECSFWMDERGARPDEETYRATMPAMMTLGDDAMLVAISTPHRQNGLLWRKFDAHYGKDDDRVLVIRASSMQLNPTLDETEVQAALERDPAAGAAEYLGEFRADLESFLSREVIDAAVDKDRPLELPVQRGCRYFGFLDAAEGGRNGDSFAAGVAYLEDGRLICAAVRERQPPFKPTEVMETMVLPLFKMYGVTRAKADKHAEGFVKDLAQRAGVTIEADAPVKSDIYREMMPWMTSGKCKLPPLDRLVNQIFGLERTRGGERIDHQRGGHDDLVNAAFGAMLGAAEGAGSEWMRPENLRRVRQQAEAMPPYRRPLGDDAQAAGARFWGERRFGQMLRMRQTRQWR
jgi:hypothetical protein